MASTHSSTTRWGTVTSLRNLSPPQPAHGREEEVGGAPGGGGRGGRGHPGVVEEGAGEAGAGAGMGRRWEEGEQEQGWGRVGGWSE